MVESGFAELDVPEEQRASKVEGNTEGWEVELGNVAQLPERVTA